MLRDTVQLISGKWGPVLDPALLRPELALDPQAQASSGVPSDPSPRPCSVPVWGPPQGCSDDVGHRNVPNPAFGVMRSRARRQDLGDPQLARSLREKSWGFLATLHVIQPVAAVRR